MLKEKKVFSGYKLLEAQEANFYPVPVNHTVPHKRDMMSLSSSILQNSLSNQGTRQSLVLALAAVSSCVVFGNSEGNC